MKIFMCDKCGEMFYPIGPPSVLDGDKIPDLCPKCKRELVDFYLNVKHKEKEGDNFDYLDEFCNQLKRIKSISPELRIGQIIYLINSTISSDCDSFYIEDKDYVNVAENYADRLEHRRSY